MRAALVLCLLAGGCSFALTRRTPAGPRKTCTSYIPAAIDTAAAAALTAKAVAFQMDRDCGPDGCHTFDETPLYVLPAVVFAASAVYGYVTDHTCRQAQPADS